MDKRFLNNFAFGRLRTSSEDFGRLQKTSEMIVLSSKIQALQDKNLMLISQKKLAGILLSVSMDGKDGHGLKLEKVEPTFSSFNAMSTKITKKILWLVFPDEI